MLVIYVLIERYLYSIHTCQPIWFTSIKYSFFSHYFWGI